MDWLKEQLARFDCERKQWEHEFNEQQFRQRAEDVAERDRGKPLRLLVIVLVGAAVGAAAAAIGFAN